MEGKEIKEVSIRELTGGRAPLREEMVKFETPVRKDLKKQRAVARTYMIIGILIIMGCAVRVFTAKGMTPAESVMHGILALAAGGVDLIALRLQMKIRFLYKMFTAGNYVVWGCKIRKVKGDSGKPTMQVKITTLIGESCDGWFVSDTTSAREADKGIPHDFWLLAFPRKDKVLWSKLISDGQL